MTCQAGGNGNCGQCDACTGRAAYEWGSVAGAGAQSALAASGQQTWKSLGFEGWGSESERSAFCEMLERIASLLAVSKSIQAGVRDATLEAKMIELAGATWALKPPQALREPQQLRTAEEVLTRQIMPPVRAIAQKIGALSAPKSKPMLGFLQRRKKAPAVPAADATALEQAKMLGTAILADGKKMTEGLSRFKAKVAVAQNTAAFASTRGSLMTSAPKRGLRAAGGGSAAESAIASTSRASAASEFADAMAFARASGSGLRTSSGGAWGGASSTNADGGLDRGGQGGTSGSGSRGLDFSRMQQHAIGWESRGMVTGNDDARESRGSRNRPDRVSGRSDPLMLT